MVMFQQLDQQKVSPIGLTQTVIAELGEHIHLQKLFNAVTCKESAPRLTGDTSSHSIWRGSLYQHLDLKTLARNPTLALQVWQNYAGIRRFGPQFKIMVPNVVLIYEAPCTEMQLRFSCNALLPHQLDENSDFFGMQGVFQSALEHLKQLHKAQVFYGGICLKSMAYSTRSKTTKLLDWGNAHWYSDIEHAPYVAKPYYWRKEDFPGVEGLVVNDYLALLFAFLDYKVFINNGVRDATETLMHKAKGLDNKQWAEWTR